MEAFAYAQHAFAPALASALLHSLWQNALLAAAAALALKGMARASAAARHNVGMIFLIARLLLPLLQFLHLWQQPGASIEGGLLPVLTSSQAAPGGRVFVQQSTPLATFVALLWMAGAAMMLLRHASGLHALRVLECRPSQSPSAHWQQRLDEMRRALGIGRAVVVRLSDEWITPCTARLVRPVIWLPLSLLTRAPAEQVEALLAHELAHIARRDWLWNGVQCIAESLLFFHPAAWWLGRRIRQEREHACDDLAVSACGDAIALAEALASLERGRRASPALALAAHGGSLMQRITRLVSAPPPRAGWGIRGVLAAFSLAGIVLAAQIGLAGGHLPDLLLESSTDGPLGPGDYRQISANGLDKQRFYRVSLDASGRMSQVYKEDGEVRPIGPETRRWIAEVTRLGTPPLGPLPRIDMRHDIPSIAELQARAESDALIALAAAHPEVIARLGAPAFAAAGPINGKVRVAGENGDADISVRMRGPRGEAEVSVQAEFRKHVWTLRSVAVE